MAMRGKASLSLVVFVLMLIWGCSSKQSPRVDAKPITPATPMSQQLQSQTSLYQQLMKKLQSEIKANKVGVKQFENQVRITIPNDVLFPGGGWTLDRKGIEILDKIVTILKDLKNQAIEVYGYTDNAAISGSQRSRFSTNRELSLARAVDIVNYFEKKGIDRDILSATGYGSEQSLATNDTPAGRAKNRRVEIAIMGIDG
jgi:chemotaxis protein MotB